VSFITLVGLRSSLVAVDLIQQGALQYLHDAASQQVYGFAVL
jgi:hypothetical protein